MAKNLNYAVEGSYCGVDKDDGTYNITTENTTNCDIYGRLYTWGVAIGEPDCNDKKCLEKSTQKLQGVCPEGWRIPSNEDWNVLMKFVNPKCSDNTTCANAGAKLRSVKGWNDNIVGTDDYGFAALPGGSGNASSGLWGVGNRGDWWSASEILANNSNGSYCMSIISKSSNFSWLTFMKTTRSGVRCVKDVANE